MNNIWTKSLLIGATLDMLVACRHGKVPWEGEKEYDHKTLQILKEEPARDPKKTSRVPLKSAPNEEDDALTLSSYATHSRKHVSSGAFEPPALLPAYYRPISVSLTEDIPLKMVLPEVARQVGIDLQLDPKITESILFYATQQPFIEVIHHMCDMAGLRYRIRGKSLRIELDRAYSHNYNVQFLNLKRSTDNHASIATDVFATNRNGQKGDNGSSSAISMSHENDFWHELEGTLSTLLGGEGRFSLHKQGGVVSVFATQAQHEKVRRYLSKLRKSARAQVLIEAKVIEVDLRDQYRSGINWQKIAGGSPSDLRFNAPFGTNTQNARFLNPADAQNTVVTLGGAGRSFSSILHAIEEFGMSRTLSSPRLTVLNNQSAILKVAQNEVYFRLNYNRQYNTNVNRESFNVSSDIQTVPIGLVMAVQPSIDADTGEIILSLRPTISRLSKSVRDPAVDIAINANIQAGNAAGQVPPSLVPVVEVREIDSVLRLKDQEIGVLGGLMEVRSSQDRSFLPGVGHIPVVGELVKERSDGDSLIELVILLKASIVDEGAAPDTNDDRVYAQYIEDPRRF